MSNICRSCKDCGKDISNLQPQCIRCVYCQKKFVQKKSKTFLNEKKKIISESLGTTDFSQHRKKDFNKEAAAIKKEMKNLGLK